MGKGINKVILVGNLGQDPETRHSGEGNAITNISVATTDEWTDKNTKQKQSKTEWHRVVFFNRLAEIAGEYLKKGSQVYIEGRLQTRKWQDQSGQDRYTTEIVASEMQMLGGREVVGQGHQPSDNFTQQPQQAPSPAPHPTQQVDPPVQQKAPAPHPAINDFDDEVPF